MGQISKTSKKQRSTILPVVEALEGRWLLSGSTAVSPFALYAHDAILATIQPSSMRPVFCGPVSTTSSQTSPAPMVRHTSGGAVIIMLPDLARPGDIGAVIQVGRTSDSSSQYLDDTTTDPNAKPADEDRGDYTDGSSYGSGWTQSDMGGDAGFAQGSVTANIQANHGQANGPPMGNGGYRTDNSNPGSPGDSSVIHQHGSGSASDGSGSSTGSDSAPPGNVTATASVATLTTQTASRASGITDPHSESASLSITSMTESLLLATPEILSNAPSAVTHSISSTTTSVVTSMPMITATLSADVTWSLDDIASASSRAFSGLVEASHVNELGSFIINGSSVINVGANVQMVSNDLVSQFAGTRHLFKWGLSPNAVSSPADMMEGMLLANASALADVANSAASRVSLQAQTLWREAAGIMGVGALVGSYAISKNREERKQTATAATIPARFRCIGEPE